MCVWEYLTLDINQQILQNNSTCSQTFLLLNLHCNMDSKVIPAKKIDIFHPNSRDIQKDNTLAHNIISTRKYLTLPQLVGELWVWWGFHFEYFAFVFLRFPWQLWPGHCYLM